MFWLKFREHFNLVPTVDIYCLNSTTWKLWQYEALESRTTLMAWYRYFNN